MKIKNSILGCGAALLLLAGNASAQEEAKPEGDAKGSSWMDNLYLGAGLGTNIGYTDIKQYDLYPVFKYHNEWGVGFNGFLGYQLHSAVSLEGNLGYATVNGTHRDFGVYFSGNTIESSLNLKLNFSNLIFSSKKKNDKFAFYGYAGLGLTSFRSQLRQLVNDNDEDPILSFQGYESAGGDKSSRTKEIVIPVGAGVTYKLNKNFDVFFDISLKLVNTDKLDSWVSTNNSKDKYNYNSLGVKYRFGDKSWKKPEEEVIDQLASLDSILDGFKDSDGDGVMDTYDSDNKTPEGALTYGNGTAVDTDGDGVYDYADEERLSPCTEVDENGVALDSDKDGVANCKDVEPNSAEGCQVSVNGKCIETGGLPAGGGSEDASTGGVSSGLSSVYFALNSVSIDYRNYPALTEVAQFMKSNPKVNVVVVGHTDASGSKAYNEKLGKQRSQAVISHLVKIYGIDNARLSAASKGKSEILAKGAGSTQNRRVDFLIAK